MNKKVKNIIIFIAIIPVAFAILIVGLFAYYYVEVAVINAPIEQKNEARPLTEQEQSFVGVWKADDGCLLAVRARGGFDAESFALDAICETFIDSDRNHRAWFKITRDIDTTLEMDGELLVISDKFNCPDLNNNTRWVTTEERLEYDAQTDTLTYISRHQDFNETKVFHRTDLDPTDKSIDWDWYYDIHPNRKP